MKLLQLFYLFVNISMLTCELTDKQEKRINTMAWLLARFSLTFDPDKIGFSNSENLEQGMNQLTINEANGDKTMLFLYSYFRNNEQEFDNYKEILDFFGNDNLKILFPSVDLNELIRIFEERVKTHQNDIVSKNKIPLTFKKFYTIFQMLRDLVETNSVSHSFETLGDIPINHPLLQLFCNEHFKTQDQERVITALNNFNLRKYKFVKKLKGREKESLTLSNDFIQHLKGNEDSKPKKWSIHHMIPSETIVIFYEYYFQLLSQKSENMNQHKKFDWIKISEFNTQLTFLVEADTLWRKFRGITRPVDDFGKNVNSAQEDFVKYWYRWPIGLLFYGPDQSIRSDDPSKPDNQKLFNQPNDFELYAANIVGQEYFDKVKELNSNILAFVEAYKSKTNNSNDLFEMAFKIYNRLLTIHREAPWDNKIIAPYNSEQWTLKDETNLWEIKTDWAVKALAQQQDLRQQEHQLGQFISGLERIQLLDPVLLSSFYMYRTGPYGRDPKGPAGSRRHDETKRRKRHHLYDHLFYVQQLETKCLAPVMIIQKKDACDYYLNNGSPSILAVPVYGWCKLFG